MNEKLTRVCLNLSIILKEMHRENTLSINTQALTKSMNMEIWVVFTSNELFIKGSYSQIKFSNKRVVSAKAVFCMIGPFCTSHSVCLNIGF